MEDLINILFSLTLFMSVLITKSKQNIASAGLLHRNDRFASSIHCSYYACVQLILFIIKENPKRYQEFKEKYKSFNSADLNSFNHKHFINYISLDLVKSSVTFDYGRSFSQNIGILKKERNQADYSDINKISKDSERCMTKANDIIKDLTLLYDIK